MRQGWIFDIRASKRGEEVRVVTQKEVESQVGRRSFFEKFTIASYPFEEQS
jgi:hypothetical protein